MSRVELIEAIRRDARLEGLGIRALARRHKVHRRAVREALASALPPPRKVAVRAAPALGPFHAQIRAWLVADRAVPRKQRHTARRIWQRLTDECGAVVAESTVRGYVAAVRAELAGGVGVVTVPQLHAPGAEAEVDFGELWVVLAGTVTKCWLFVMRLSASGKAVHHVFATQAQEAFLEGHVLAFAAFAGVPARVRYDNLKAAVTRVLRGRDRTESERFVLLRSHYGFDSFFCIPGPDGAHEKGGVEGEIGRFRRHHLVPVPRVDTLAELNERISAADRGDDARHVDGRVHTVGQDFELEWAHLSPLPVEAFDCARELSAKVDTKAPVSVRLCTYSVPARYAGRRLRVRLGAQRLEVLDGATVVARHERAVAKGTETLELDHYLEVLGRKPGALPAASALAQARARGDFTATHERFWSEARRRLGDRDGTRALIEVLLAHRHLPAAAVLAGMDRALGAGSVDPAVVVVEARRASDEHDERSSIVVPIALATTDRPPPDLDGYDTLLAAGGGS